MEELLNYGARMYDPTIGRWNVVDNLADHPNQIDKSPFGFTWNNPINYIDPDGNCPSCPQGEDAAAVYADGAQVTNSDGSWTWTGSDWQTNETTASTEPSESSRSESEIWSEAMSTESDADIISVGFDFALGKGAGVELQFIRINKGEDKGWHVYTTGNFNVGYGIGGGVTVTSVDFNEGNSAGLVLDNETFVGGGNNYTGSYGVVSFNRGHSTINSNFTLNPNPSNVLYTTKGFGVGPGLGYYYQATGTAKRK